MADLSDLSDEDLESLLENNVNRSVNETVTRRSIPVQRDLFMNVLPNQRTFYEETHVDVKYGPTHHQLNEENLHEYIYPTNYEVRQYQYDIVRCALFENVLCAIPTGTGKTFIASTVMLNYYRWTKTSKIIFTAPTRPLVAQQIKACLGITGIPYSDTAILLDKSRKNREEIWQQKRVFFTTPQVVENDLKRGVLNPKDVVLLVIDEAHRARGNYAYVELTKFIDRFNTSYRLLALTATPAADLQGVQEVVNNLHISKVELRTEDSLDVARYMMNRDREMVEIELIPEIEEVIEQIGIAIAPVLQEAIQLGIYDNCEPHQINAFVAMQQSQKIILNPSLPEGLKWKNFFILQLLSQVGHMYRRLRIYGLRAFYNYFQNKYTEFTTKYTMKKSTNKTAANFYYSPILKTVIDKCKQQLEDPDFHGHEKLTYLNNELRDFFVLARPDSRAIIFTELRESALEIVKSIDIINDSALRPHIFIGQAKGKEQFDEETYVRKNKPKGRSKADRLRRIEEEKRVEEEKKKQKEQAKLDRTARRTGSSEEAQLSGMNQKQQKTVISDFKKGIYNVLVCTSIGEEGLDIGEVDLIICFDSTSSPIKNIQRMGRTGRKRDGRIVLLFSGNEKFKFEQAMNDYGNLQNAITHDALEYTKSDRILPANYTPQCKEKFIIISNENDEVNRLEDSDEVIKYATQAMLGKLKTKNKKEPKPKKTSAKAKKASEKTFFMPDNVNEGFTSASSMLNKYTINEFGEKVNVDPSVSVSEKIIKPKKEWNMLDEIEYDSVEISPAKSQVEEPSQAKKGDALQQLQQGILTPDETTNHIPSASQNSSVQTEPRTVLEPILKKLKLSHPENDADNHDYTALSKSDSASLEPSTEPQKIRQKRHEREKEFDNGFELAPVFTAADSSQLLTNQEQKYFLKKYVPDTVQWSIAPDLFRAKTSKIPHVVKIDTILKTFQDMHANTREKIIEMNRTNALARSMGYNRSVGMELEVMLPSIIVPTSTNPADLLEDEDGLSDFLSD
ncbi:unnamed protein product [Kluyveromyces dobzhanskii CBS 2104]|uniref:ATP-dependent DNA helicase n=1 Tax=Kluyveromyces dobzhanskii CBS 2104 TaxID=1427455 RepID=A0A0A8L6Q0_9SACH|nr:unnamed protein product [Kluyveromyces dobzhanskii CBS 2104]